MVEIGFISSIPQILLQSGSSQFHTPFWAGPLEIPFGIPQKRFKKTPPPLNPQGGF